MDDFIISINDDELLVLLKSAYEAGHQGSKELAEDAAIDILEDYLIANKKLPSPDEKPSKNSINNLLKTLASKHA